MCTLCSPIPDTGPVLVLIRVWAVALMLVFVPVHVEADHDRAQMAKRLELRSSRFFHPVHVIIQMVHFRGHCVFIGRNICDINRFAVRCTLVSQPLRYRQIIRTVVPLVVGYLIEFFSGARPPYFVSEFDARFTPDPELLSTRAGSFLTFLIFLSS